MKNADGTEEYVNWLSSELEKCNLGDTYRFTDGWVYTTLDGHEIYAKKMFLGAFPYKKKAAEILSEPKMAKPSQKCCVNFLKFDGLKIKIENPDYKSKIENIAEDFKQKFGENYEIF